MRPYKEIQAEIGTLEGRSSETLNGLYQELRESREHEIRLAAMEDALAGRKNSCVPTLIDSRAAWQDRGTGILQCSYCGSLHPEEAVKLLQTAGTSYSGSDWKYGFPHKFYIGKSKFYTKHLLDASPETFQTFAELSLELFGIGWDKKEDGRVFYNFPATKTSAYGYQRWGVVGKTTCVRCGCIGGESIGFCACPVKCHPDPIIPEARPWA